jgi:hypothetical protein
MTKSFRLFFFLFKILPLMDQSKVGHCKNKKNWTLGFSSLSGELIFFQICEVGGLAISLSLSLSLSLKMARWLRQLWVLVKEESRKQFGIPLIVWPYVAIMSKCDNFRISFASQWDNLGPFFQFLCIICNSNCFVTRSENLNLNLNF